MEFTIDTTGTNIDGLLFGIAFGSDEYPEFSEFGADDMITVENASFTDDDLIYTATAGTLAIDTDQDGGTDTTISLEGDFASALFTASPNGANTNIILGSSGGPEEPDDGSDPDQTQIRLLGTGALSPERQPRPDRDGCPSGRSRTSRYSLFRQDWFGRKRVGPGHSLGPCGSD